jgi:hypothetical protein
VPLAAATLVWAGCPDRWDKEGEEDWGQRHHHWFLLLVQQVAQVGRQTGCSAAAWNPVGSCGDVAGWAGVAGARGCRGTGDAGKDAARSKCGGGGSSDRWLGWQ